MARFIVAAIQPLLPLLVPPPPSLKVISAFYIADAANDQAAIDLVAGWDAEPAGTDYVAIPFNPKRASGNGK